MIKFLNKKKNIGIIIITAGNTVNMEFKTC